MRIELVVTQPVEVHVKPDPDDLKAARAAGIETDPEGARFDSVELADWLVSYWCSARSDYAINDIVSNEEVGRDAPSASDCYVNGVFGDDGWSL